MRRIVVLILAVFVLSSGFSVSAFAGRRVFLHIGGHHFFAGVRFFFHHRKSSRHLFLQLGHPWLRHPWRHSYPGVYPPPLFVPYSAAPQGTPQAAFRGKDPSGALYVSGYPVLPSGWLRFLIEPVDAKAMIDGFPVLIDQASGTSASVGLPIGKQQIEVRKAGYQSYQSEVEIKQAREVFLGIALHQ